jgi:ubiquitin carboxyl-terminal hydrolase 7
MVIIFLKYFDIMKQSLFGVGEIHMRGAKKVSNLIPIINERMEWAPGTPLKLYEVAN